jgi:hypothetical protein
MYLISISYIALKMNIGSSIDEKSHHLRAAIESSSYQGSQPILSEEK